MKKKSFFLMTILSALFVFATTNTAKAVVQVTPSSEQIVTAQSTDNSVLSRAQMEEQLGRKMTLKERIAFKFAKKRSLAKNGGKLQLIALVLCIFLGLIGIHRFYLGYTGMGIIYIFTAGLFGIGWLIDLVLLIIPNGLSPKGRNNYRA